jgi:putative selenate reductase FAD-binding subunit
MPTVISYHRPQRLDDAVRLLSTGPHRVALAGGTVLNAAPVGAPVEVVDLQAVGLDRIHGDSGRVVLGAMCRLDDVARDGAVPAFVRDAARRELPSTLRTLATIGGTVGAADGDSELLAALLVHDAIVHVAGTGGEEIVPLPQVLADHRRIAGRVITAVEIATGGDAVAERTARTPADVPIVSCSGRRGEDGRLRTAFTGVAPQPVLLDAAAVERLRPEGDFRGSSTYRAQLAAVLHGRVLAALGEGVDR